MTRVRAIAALSLLITMMGCEYPAITTPRDAQTDVTESGVPIDAMGSDANPDQLAADDGMRDVMSELPVLADTGMDAMTMDTFVDAERTDVVNDNGCAGLLCGASCIDPNTDMNNCGACGTVCSGADRCLGGRCIGPPRLIAPASLGYVTSKRPTFRWVGSPRADGARVEVCRDRACTMVIATLMGATSVAPTSDLPRGVLFWRAFARAGALEHPTPSATWELVVGFRSAAVDTTHGSMLDVNGDGFADVAVGAPNAGVTAPREPGLVYVFLGSATGLSSSPHRVLEGVDSLDGFGTSVANAGDVNGDGFGDLVVGSPNADPGGRVGAGTAAVFLGSPTGIAASPQRILDGLVDGDAFGRSVGGAGDVNRDGFADIVIGSHLADRAGALDSGAATVFHGSRDGIGAMPAQTLRGEVANDRFGIAVSTAGDVNGDGFADLVIGAANASPSGLAQAGRAFVFSGGPSGVVAAPLRSLAGAAADDQFGWSVSAAGDVNGDGFGDVLIGSLTASPGGRREAGLVSVFAGSGAGIGTSASTTVEGPTAGDRYGWSVSGGGDLNGDGFADAVIGARFAAPGGRRAAGVASVHLGGSGGLTVSAVRLLTGVAVDDGFGYAVCLSGDVDGSGGGEVLVGAVLASPLGRSFVGSVSLYRGSPIGLDMAAPLVLPGAEAGDSFGAGIAW